MKTRSGMDSFSLWPKLLFLLILGVYGGQADPTPPSWAPSFQVTGLLQLPYAEIKEPFQGFYDAKQNMSRVDYYGTTVKTYQIAGTGKGNGSEAFGKTYKVAPMFINNTQQTGCFLVPGTSDAPVTIQSVLPDLKGFKLAGKETIEGKECQKWINITVVGQKKNTYTMWVDNQSYPVRYQMMGYDSLLGSHYDKYILDYVNYEPGNQTNDTFVVDKSLKCGDFPGPGAEHRVTMNPMLEYINRDDSHVDEMFGPFQKKHHKKYNDETDEQRRKHIFRDNVRFIHSKNRAGLSYTLGVNHMADMTAEEMAMMRGRKRSHGYNGGLPFYKNKYNLKDIPDQWDWRLFGAVTPVKDQAVCGSCWSFGTTGTLEGAYFIKTGQLVRLSQQELMDCSWQEGNNACDGGEDFRAYQWIMKNGGLSTEEGYGSGAYLAQDSYCMAMNSSAILQVQGYVNVTSSDQEALKVALAQHGPISVGIDASHRSLSFYSNGVYFESACGSEPDDLDHAVLAVGYGVLHGQPYWLIKNSWSTYWGNAGYVLMSQRDNNCGVATSPTFVVLK